MLFEKHLLGEQFLEGLQIKYYTIHKNTYFGVAIEEYQTDSILCHHEYFTDDQGEAYRIGNQMKDGLVTSTTMVNIIDDAIH